MRSWIEEHLSTNDERVPIKMRNGNNAYVFYCEDGYWYGYYCHDGKATETSWDQDGNYFTASRNMGFAISYDRDLIRPPKTFDMWFVWDPEDDGAAKPFCSWQRDSAESFKDFHGGRIVHKIITDEDDEL